MLVVGFLRLEMADLAERFGVRPAIKRCGPANEVRAPAKQYEDLAVPIRAGLEATQRLKREVREFLVGTCICRDLDL